ncbi:DUF1361 domain-containing protein [Breznakiellaceae bacterium SP9]
MGKLKAGLLKDTKRLHETLFMGALVLFCVGLSAFRLIHTQTRYLLFLNWNLFLAGIPWLITSFVLYKPKLQNIRIVALFMLVLWLLFFPNSPYILTDLFYVSRFQNMPPWFDLLMILSFAWTGLLFGFLSLWDIEAIFLKKMKRPFVSIISSFLLLMGSFGIYVGRYLRWNSWDLITQPLSLLSEIGERVAYPFEYLNTWGMTLFMGLFLNILYWSFRLIRKHD